MGVAGEWGPIFHGHGPRGADSGGVFGKKNDTEQRVGETGDPLPSPLPVKTPRDQTGSPNSPPRMRSFITTALCRPGPLPRHTVPGAETGLPW